MQLFKKLILKLTRNRFVQRLLEKNVFISQYLMGIGSGSYVESSGESAVLDLLCHNQSPPYCIVDVGSNQGQYVKLVLAAVPAGRFSIHCFEPSGYAFNKLTTNVPDTPGVVLNNFALGREKGSQKLYYDTPGSLLASFTRRRLDHFNIDFNKSEMVKVDTLDNYCRESGIERINLLKIDVEGHEMDVLSGAGSMFKNEAVDIVAFEFGGCNIDTRTSFRDFFYFFTDRNMRLSRITPAGYLYPIDDYKEIHEQFRPTNFVAVKG